MAFVCELNFFLRQRVLCTERIQDNEWKDWRIICVCVCVSVEFYDKTNESRWFIMSIYAHAARILLFIWASTVDADAAVWPPSQARLLYTQYFDSTIHVQCIDDVHLSNKEYRWARERDATRTQNDPYYPILCKSSSRTLQSCAPLMYTLFD